MPAKASVPPASTLSTSSSLVQSGTGACPTSATSTLSRPGLASSTTVVSCRPRPAGGWAVTETEDPAAVDGNRRVVIDVTLATPPHSFRFDGLFDGERIAGSVSASEAQGGESGEATVLGDFLCTRLFTFWGSPKPRAIDVT